mmetsp:Transcript_43419/g.91199  ORF Transcript_43419/g.91199 Transcript_43419/m.91199 type:complete len:262 (+) Transcript_43419:922-1707(+)
MSRRMCKFDAFTFPNCGTPPPPSYPTHRWWPSPPTTPTSNDNETNGTTNNDDEKPPRRHRRPPPPQRTAFRRRRTIPLPPRGSERRTSTTTATRSPSAPTGNWRIRSCIRSSGSFPRMLVRFVLPSRLWKMRRRRSPARRRRRRRLLRPKLPACRISAFRSRKGNLTREHHPRHPNAPRNLPLHLLTLLLVHLLQRGTSSSSTTATRATDVPNPPSSAQGTTPPKSPTLICVGGVSTSTRGPSWIFVQRFMPAIAACKNAG